MSINLKINATFFNALRVVSAKNDVRRGHTQIARVMPIDDKNSSALVEFGGFTRDQLTYVLMPMRWHA